MQVYYAVMYDMGNAILGRTDAKVAKFTCVVSAIDGRNFTKILAENRQFLGPKCVAVLVQMACF